MPVSEQPHIIVDFEIDAELVFLLIKNDSSQAAIDLQVRPSAPIIGLDGRKDIADLSIFKVIRYMAPGKEIRIFVDAYESFFRQLKKTLVEFVISYNDEEGKSYRQKISHDLAIYEDLIYFIKKM